MKIDGSVLVSAREKCDDQKPEVEARNGFQGSRQCTASEGSPPKISFGKMLIFVGIPDGGD